MKKPEALPVEPATPARSSRWTGAKRESGEDVNGDAEVVGDISEADTDIVRPSEPQLASVRESGRERLGDEQARLSVTGADRGSTVEQRSRVEECEHLGVWVADHVTVTIREPRKDLGELATRWTVHPLEEPPVPGSGQRDVVVVRQSDRPVTADDTTARYSSTTIIGTRCPRQS